ncbi:hypothetical protein [Arthrobacter sp. 2MCAF14]|uniref:hypothetical protein n=1 Tax=Arthrobacter sp. 2MCAF14 TaxID=3232982 RepID=UPI003F8FE1C2
MPPAKAARISPESRPVAFAAAGIAAAIYIGAFAASFSGLASLAVFMAIPAALQCVVPAVIDLALLLFTLATLLHRARGQSTWMTNAATAFWILVSMAANTFHVLVATPASSWGVGTYAGATLSALMPLGALGASLVLENLFIEDPAPAAIPVVAPTGEVASPAEAEAAAPSRVITAERPERTATPAVPVLAVAAAAAPRKAVVAAVSAPSKVHRATADPKAAWAAASKPEQVSIALGMKGKMSNRQIAAEIGISESTLKRLLRKTPPLELLEATA